MNKEQWKQTEEYKEFERDALEVMKAQFSFGYSELNTYQSDKNKD